MQNRTALVCALHQFAELRAEFADCMAAAEGDEEDPHGRMSSASTTASARDAPLSERAQPNEKAAVGSASAISSSSATSAPGFSSTGSSQAK